MKKILFICHGNICRSPMAEYIFKDLVRKAGIEERYFIASAATSTEEIGNDVYPPARRELLSHGIPCPGRRAVRMTAEDYGKYDYLIGMDFENMRNMERIAGKSEKLHMLMDFAGESRSVADPWYSGDFFKAYEDIMTGCRALLDLLENGKQKQ